MAKSALLTESDYWAIWIGTTFLIVGLIVFFINAPENLDAQHLKLETQMAEEHKNAPYKTMIWFDAFDQQQKIKSSKQPIGKFLKNLTGKPRSWENNPLDAFLTTKSAAKAKKVALEKKYQEALIQEKTAKTFALRQDQQAKMANYANETSNAVAIKSIANWRATKKAVDNIRKKYEIKASNKFPWLLHLFLVFLILFGLGSSFMGVSILSFAKGFTFVFLIGILAYLLGEQANMKAIGFGYAAWAIILGLLISNTIGTPNWAKTALHTEFYIKTGLVILGAEILLGKILAIGLPGIFVAWVVTPIVLITTFWFGQKILKISSKTLNMTISADMSVCGVSAAVATAAACKATKEELTIAIGLSMIFTSIMMIAEPAFINYVGMPEILGGAWIGGTVDATGAVVAAGAFLGEKALSVAATIKMIQNILIGIIAFGVAVYFATKVEKMEKAIIGWGEIWKRFPKFILGFIGASILFSLVYTVIGDNKAYTLIDQGVIGAFTKNIRGWLFCLAFASIGLSINFKELKQHFVGGKPLLLYIIGQVFNLCLTLLMAYVMFYKVFPHITENI